MGKISAPTFVLSEKKGTGAVIPRNLIQHKRQKNTLRTVTVFNYKFTDNVLDVINKH